MLYIKSLRERERERERERDRDNIMHTIISSRTSPSSAVLETRAMFI